MWGSGRMNTLKGRTIAKGITLEDSLKYESQICEALHNIENYKYIDSIGKLAEKLF